MNLFYAMRGSDGDFDIEDLLNDGMNSMSINPTVTFRDWWNAT